MKIYVYTTYRQAQPLRKETLITQYGRRFVGLREVPGLLHAYQRLEFHTCLTIPNTIRGSDLPTQHRSSLPYQRLQGVATDMVYRRIKVQRSEIRISFIHDRSRQVTEVSTTRWYRWTSKKHVLR